jgi:hypothetical protein
LLTERRRQEVNDDAISFGQKTCAGRLGGLAAAGSSAKRDVDALKSAELGTTTRSGNSLTVEVTAPEFGTSVAVLEREADGPWRVSESAAGF